MKRHISVNQQQSSSNSSQHRNHNGIPNTRRLSNATVKSMYQRERKLEAPDLAMLVEEFLFIWRAVLLDNKCWTCEEKTKRNAAKATAHIDPSHLPLQSKNRERAESHTFELVARQQT